jgi:hypothetical protein
MALRKPDVVDNEASAANAAAGSEQSVNEVTTTAVVQQTEVVKDDASTDAIAKEGAGKDAESQTGASQTVAEQGEAKGDVAATVEAASDAAAADTAAVAEPEKPEVVAEQKQVHVAAEQTTQVAVAHKTTGAMANFSQDMAEEGFEGLTLTGMSFERVKLHEANFQLGSEDVNLGDKIEVQIMSTRNLYIVRQYSGNGAEVYYSYDPEGKFKADGSSAEETLAEWRDDGYGVDGKPLDIKRYIEGMAMLVNRDDEYDGMIVTLSIPPASRDRLAGAFAVGKQLFRAAANNLIIECRVGKKIGSGDEAFRPWLFKALRVAAGEAAAA